VVEAEFVELRIGRCLLAFDGRTLELFREDISAGWRVHHRLVELGSISTDAKGRCSIEFVRRSSGESSYRLMVDTANLQQLQPVLDAFTAR
jgi:hypothetical protein